MEFTKRPTFAKIDLNNLRHNAKEILGRLPEGQEPVAIIKANAYGHGSVMVARALEAVGYKRLGVATFSEGMELRNEGIKTEIHVLNGILGPISEYCSNRLYPTLFELSQLKELSTYLNSENREFAADLKFDTGMGRLGFTPSQVDEVIKVLKQTPQLKINYVLTHLAKADDDEEFTNRQYTLFRKLRGIMTDRGLEANYCICNSAAIVDNRFEDYQFVRPGIILYGCYPNERHAKAIDLKPVMSLKSKIISLKTFGKNSPIGYGGTFVTERESVIGTLPFGYADGYPRLASNKGHVLVNGQKAPIAGRISMDLMSVDLTDVKDVALYDDVTLMGEDGKEIIRAEDIASWSETISYEVICGISPRVPRVFEGL